MASSVPQNARCIGYSRRGYSRSCPNREVDLASISGVKKSAGDDLVTFLQYIVAELGVLQQGGKLILVGWSSGAWPIFSAYSRLNLYATQSKEILMTMVSGIIFYETPAGQSLTVDRAPESESSWQKLFAAFSAPGATPETDTVQNAALELFSAYWDYSPWILNEYKQYQAGLASCTTHQSLSSDPQFHELHLTGVIEMKQFVPDSASRWDEDQSTSRDIVMSSIAAMARSASIETIRGILTMHTIPDCILGTSWLIGEFKRAGAENANLDIVEGPWNHYFHNTNPALFWKTLNRM